jgi:flagellar biosynthetic protein FlhB
VSDQQDKTEQATPHKLEEARKKGMIPHSPDLLSFASVVVFLIVITATAGNLVRVIATVSQRWWGEAGHVFGNGGYALQALQSSLVEIAYALTPLVAALIIATIVLSVLFNGFVLSLEPMKPDFKRLHPVNGLKRIFSRRTLNELAKLFVKGLLFAGIAVYLSSHVLARLMEAANKSLVAIGGEVLGLMLRVGFAFAAVMALSAVWDLWFSRREFAKQMRMSRRELKDEHRKKEGDPDIKAKRKGVQKELLQKVGALARVKDADVIVTNPTHVAVALQYRPAEMMVPIVLASGKGLLAAQIRRSARKHMIPVLRRPALARHLYRSCGVRHPVPLDAHQDVAAIYRWIISIPGNKVVHA